MYQDRKDYYLLEPKAEVGSATEFAISYIMELDRPTEKASYILPTTSQFLSIIHDSLCHLPASKKEKESREDSTGFSST